MNVQRGFRTLALALAAAFLLLPSQLAFAAESGAARDSGVLSWLDRDNYGRTPPPFETGYLRVNPNPPARSRAALPRRFNVVEAGGAPDRQIDQGGWGTCWSIAAMRAAESSLYEDGDWIVDDPLLEEGFSARHLAWFTCDGRANPDAPEDGTEGDSYLVPPDAAAFYGEEGAFQIGGNSWKAAATLSRLKGLTYAARIPYPEPAMFDSGIAQGGSALRPEYRDGYAAVDGELRFDSFYRLREMTYLPTVGKDGEPDPSAVKQMLLDGFAPTVAFYADQKYIRPYQDSAYTCYTEFDGGIGNHDVSLIGWDDTIPAEAFVSDEGNHPEGDGGWLIRNSWGPVMEYLYISYYDRNIQDFYCYSVEPPRYDFNYQYDGLGTAVTGNFGAEGTQIATRFTATGGQRLDAVSFYTMDHGVTVQIQVFTGCSDTDPESGTPRLGGGQSEWIEFAGYHTVELDRPVVLRQGQPFSVVITLSGREIVHFSTEWGVDDWAAASISRGQSFCRMMGEGDESWLDLADIDMCATIKAFTTDLEGDGGGDDGGSDGGDTPRPGGGGGSSGTAGQLSGIGGAVDTVTMPLTAPLAKALADTAFGQAASRAQTGAASPVTVPVTLRNYTDLPPEALAAILASAREVSVRTGVAITPQIFADTVQNGRILGRLYLDPASCKAPLRLWVLPDDPETRALFTRYFSNSIRAIRLTQESGFGAPAGVAVAADLTGLDTNALRFYRYNPETNRYRPVQTAYWIDENGYLHFTVTEGGRYLIADGALTLR